MTNDKAIDGERLFWSRPCWICRTQYIARVDDLVAAGNGSPFASANAEPR